MVIELSTISRGMAKIDYIRVNAIKFKASHELPLNFNYTISLKAIIALNLVQITRSNLSVIFKFCHPSLCSLRDIILVVIEVKGRSVLKKAI